MSKLAEIIASFVKGSPQQEEREEQAPTPPVSKEAANALRDRASSSAVPQKKVEAPQSSGVEKVALREEVQESGVIITPEFKRASELIRHGAPFIFITGRAGTGKSTFVDLLKEELNNYAIVAPTGVAALNVGGQTIHSFFRFKPGPIEFSKIKAVRNKIAYKALKILIIDEISMVRADLLDAIDLMLRKNSKEPKKPFGGVQVVAIGDMFQLPPIVSSEEEAAYLEIGYESPFFFSANCLKEMMYPAVEFTKVFRQKEEEFIHTLNGIREGKGLDKNLPLINKRVRRCDESDFEGIILTTTNNVASRINSKQLIEITTPHTTYTGEIRGQFRVDKNKLPAPYELVLKVGARVMFVKNDKNRRWVNGTIGEVISLGRKSVRVRIADGFGIREVEAEPVKWETNKFEYDADKEELVAHEVGSYEQIPLTLAWAVTIHKSQGKTFDRVHINLGRGAFAEGQVYVALSRCRTFDGVSLERPLSKEDIILDFDVIDFHKRVVRGGRG